MRLPRSRAQMILGLSLLVTVAADFMTGPKVSLGVFYLAIACFSSWCVGERTGLAVGALAVFMLAANRGLAVDGPVTHIERATLFWNMLARCLTSIIVVAIASGLRHALDQARWSATTDPLTGVLNKAAFHRRLGSLVGHAERRGDSLVLAYIDLDGFKGVNDGFGHAAGDAALQAVAQRLLDNVRDSDVVGRMGGDEFAVVLVQADLPTAQAKAASLAQVIEATPVSFGEWSAPIHVSYGVREIDADADPEVILAEADATMFVSKRSRAAG